jgi:hypothetical protein
MLDTLIVLISFGVELYALIDAARTEQSLVRNLPKWAWVLTVLFFGFFGALAWFFAGRPKGPQAPRVRKVRGGRPIPPDDNPEFLGKL